MYCLWKLLQSSFKVYSCNPFRTDFAETCSRTRSQESCTLVLAGQQLVWWEGRANWLSLQNLSCDFSSGSTGFGINFSLVNFSHSPNPFYWDVWIWKWKESECESGRVIYLFTSPLHWNQQELNVYGSLKKVTRVILNFRANEKCFFGCRIFFVILFLSY